MLGSPCQGPRSGLPPPISYVMPCVHASPSGLGFAATVANPPGPGENSWPPVGRKDGRRWGEPMAVLGEKPMAIDRLVAEKRQALAERPLSRESTAVPRGIGGTPPRS